MELMNWLCPECGLELHKHLISIDCPVSDVDAPGPACWYCKDKKKVSFHGEIWSCPECCAPEPTLCQLCQREMPPHSSFHVCDVCRIKNAPESCDNPYCEDGIVETEDMAVSCQVCNPDPEEKPKNRYWCCKAEYGHHEADCPNAGEETKRERR